MPQPMISVIINTYNYGRFIEDAIDSVLAQDFPAEQMEILVVDDGSIDDTAERVKKYGNRVQYFYKQNGDQASAVTFGVARAKGDLLALLDGDDLWFPNKLSRVAQEFQKDSRVVMVYNQLLFWDSRDDSAWKQNSPEVSGDIIADRLKLLTYVNAPTSALAFRRAAFERLSNVPVGRPFSYDLYLAMTAPFLGAIACVPEALTKYRVHGGNRHFAGRSEPDMKTIARRIGRQQAALDIIRQWVRLNAPRSLRPQSRILLRRWRLMQDRDEFLLNAPGRFRFFLHHTRQIRTYSALMTRAHFAYRCVYALAILVVGRHAHYLEGVRTRVRTLRARFWCEPSGEIVSKL